LGRFRYEKVTLEFVAQLLASAVAVIGRMAGREITALKDKTFFYRYVSIGCNFASRKTVASESRFGRENLAFESGAESCVVSFRHVPLHLLAAFANQPRFVGHRNRKQ